jgi:SAM-dependent methyltransferase
MKTPTKAACTGVILIGAREIAHPAKYSRELLPLLGELLQGSRRVLDPFAGTGRLRQVRPDAYLLEIELTWAAAAAAVAGDAQRMPFPAGAFDAVCTSPAYGNRMADRYVDGGKRNTYRHALGKPLHPQNGAGLQWGERYRELHRAAWQEVRRVLAPGGLLVLNVSDHIRAGKRQAVGQWHCETLQALGFVLLARHDVKTPRQRYGANGALRVESEQVYLLRKGSVNAIP